MSRGMFVVQKERGIWHTISAGGISGGCWGILEAVLRLTGSSNGAYDAIFWSYSFYVLFGVTLGILFWPLNYLFMLRGWSVSLRWSFFFCSFLLGFSIWAMESWYGSIFILPMIWLGEVFLRQSPLKVIVRPKGSIAMVSVLFVLTFVFSLTTGPIPPKLLWPESFQTEKSNILILSIEGLRVEDIHKDAPNISLLRSRSVRFEQTYSDSLEPQKAMTAMLGGQHSWLREEYLDENFESLAELFFRSGFHTTAVVNELALGVHSGLNQGFERYTYLPPNAPFPFTEGARRVKIIDIFLRFWADMGGDPGRYHRSSTEVFQQLKSDMLNFDGENWFAFAQIRELDPPYFFESRSGFRRAKKGEEEQAYRERLRRLDGSLGSFFRWLEYREKDLIVILMSTHPPSYAEDVPRFQVPLSMMVPHRHMQEVQEHAQLIDIPPTLAGIFGFSPQHWNGVDLLQDTSHQQGRPIYSHTPQGWSMVQFDGWRYMLDERNGEGRLYNVQRDPMLQHNLWNEEPNRRSQLQEVLRSPP